MAGAPWIWRSEQSESLRVYYKGAGESGGQSTLFGFRSMDDGDFRRQDLTMVETDPRSFHSTLPGIMLR